MKPVEFSCHGPGALERGGVDLCAVRANAQRGFSLLEVLVAFAILAVSLTILLQIFGGGTRSLRISEEYRQAAVAAESVLAQVGHTLPLAPGEQTGSMGGFQWRLVQVPYVDPVWPDLGRGLLLVEVNLEWPGGATGRNLSLMTLVVDETAGNFP